MDVYSQNCRYAYIVRIQLNFRGVDKLSRHSLPYCKCKYINKVLRKQKRKFKQHRRQRQRKHHLKLKLICDYCFFLA